MLVTFSEKVSQNSGLLFGFSATAVFLEFRLGVSEGDFCYSERNRERLEDFFSLGLDCIEIAILS